MANSLNLKKLDSQSGRLKNTPTTRGVKAQRLQLIKQLSPINTDDAAVYKWSATSVAINGDKAYVTWHSNRQASTQATMFGGGIDIITIPSQANGADYNFTLSETYANHSLTSDDEAGKAEVFKFNNIVATPTNLYIVGSGDKNGAMVSRLAYDNLLANNVVNVPGSSANAVAVDANGNLVVVTGYSGGAYNVVASAFGSDTKITDDNALYDNTKLGVSFGGKYITDNYILRTDEAAAALINRSTGTSYTLDAPLISSDKYAESFDDATDSWKPNDGPQKAIYGKHTMAELDGYVYVAAGKNGIRVYKTGTDGSVTEKAVWSNGIMVTAVCAFNAKDADGKSHPMIAAATEIGLRIYRPYNDAVQNQEDKVLLYAYEVDKYNEDGEAQSTTAYANGHSANFIAVDETNGFIFVAYGQDGVNIYRLDASLYNEINVENLRELIIPAINNKQSQTVEKADDPATFTIPKDEPEDVPEGKKFGGWVEQGSEDDPDAKVYKAGDEITVTPENPAVILVPKWIDENETPDPTTKHTITFNPGEGGTGTYQPVDVEDGKTLDKPEDPTPKNPDEYFDGWYDGDTKVEFPYSPTDDVTLTAKYKKYPYIVYFDANFSGITDPDPIRSKESTISVSDVKPTTDKKLKFVGWYDNEDCDGNAITEVTFTEEGTKTLYAKWTESVEGDGSEGDNTGGNETKPNPDDTNGGEHTGGSNTVK